MMITLSKTHLSEINNHGQLAYPEECCGAMLGTLDFEKNIKTTEKLVRIENTSTENRHRRFAITPEDYKSLETQAKQEGLTLLGFYHTHPDHPPIPSETDLKYAWPVFSYIILSVRNGDPAQCLSYQLNLDTEKFEPEELKIIES